jgi:hypothetical protein
MGPITEGPSLHAVLDGPCITFRDTPDPSLLYTDPTTETAGATPMVTLFWSERNADSLRP